MNDKNTIKKKKAAPNGVGGSRGTSVEARGGGAGQKKKTKKISGAKAQRGEVFDNAAKTNKAPVLQKNGKHGATTKNRAQANTKKAASVAHATGENTKAASKALGAVETRKTAQRVFKKSSTAKAALHVGRGRDSMTDGSYKKGSGTLRVMSLGGLGEIGKNMTVLEYGEDILVIDCGVAFPDEEMPGVDLVIPDITYLTNNAHKVRGILITHGHEDHVGAVAYILSSLNVPVYGTRLSIGIIQGKIEENPPKQKPQLYTVEASDVIELGVFRAEFIHVNHSIADACALAIRTPVGTVFHTGDFKLDVSPLDGQMMDLVRIGQIGKSGVELLLCESTNAERAGFTPSERTVGSSFERIFSQYEDRRIIIATFSSNVHRVQQIINASCKMGRKVAVLGRSMVNIIGAAAELGYMDFPEDVLIDVSEIKKYRPGEITLITTGSQGEPMSALYRIAFSEHDRVKLDSSDVVVLSSSAIPGNEKLVGKIINALIKNGVKVVNDASDAVHVSGHACREEIKLMISLLKPKYFMPIHGEERHLYANREIAEFMGIPTSNIFISELGRVLEINRHGAKFSGTVPTGKVLVDGSGVGDIGSVVLRDRKHLSEDGLVVVVATVDMKEGLVMSGPDIVSRGFVYVKESETLLDGAKRLAYTTLESAVSRHRYDWQSVKTELRDALAKYIYKETKRKPMILPVIMDL